MFPILANMRNMNTKTKVSAAEFQNNFGRYADAARQAPVVVTRYGRDELVVLSAAEYERMRASFRRVVVLNETSEDEAAEVIQALANAPATPAAEALDYLMSDDTSTSA
jgi:prevent-host-death family protein